jgi:hypothetical protein
VLKLKKFVLGLTCGIALSATTAVYASNTLNAYIFPVKYVFNGQSKELDSEYTTLNYNGHAYVPIRYVAENMGSFVGYDEKTQTIKINYNTDSTQNIKTESYSLAVPKTWTVDIQHDTVHFFKNGKEIGGLEIEGYIPPDTVYVPNHSELIEKKMVDGFFTSVIQASFNLTQPAASQDTSVTKETHFYFLINDKKQAYDLYFNLENVDEQTMMNIVKSLALNH